MRCNNDSPPQDNAHAHGGLADARTYAHGRPTLSNDCRGLASNGVGGGLGSTETGDEFTTLVEVLNA